MTDVIVFAFDGVDTAAEARDRLIDLNSQYLLNFQQLVAVVRKKDGEVIVKEEPRLTGSGAVGGGFWGLLVGLIFLIPSVGFIKGTVSGAMAGHFAKYGISKNYMKDIEATIQLGGSALIALAIHEKIDRIIPELQEFHPRVLKMTLSMKQEKKLRETFGGSGGSTRSVTA